MILWDKAKKGYAIFYGMLSELKEQFKRDSTPFPIKFLEVPKDVLIAVSVSMGLMAIYNNSGHRVSFRSYLSLLRNAC